LAYTKDSNSFKSQQFIGIRMIKRISALAFSSMIVIASANVTANTFFSNLKESEVQAIFDRADNSKKAVYLTNKSQTDIPAVQILPKSDNPKFEITATTSCIKLYSCNQNICLVDLNGKKYATSEKVLNQFTQLQVNTDSCLTQLPKTLATKALKPAKAVTVALFKVIKVPANDSLNVRQSANYKSKKVATLAFNASCIKRLSCKGKWCKIEQSSMLGWVHKNYLAPLNASEASHCL